MINEKMFIEILTSCEGSVSIGSDDNPSEGMAAYDQIIRGQDVHISGRFENEGNWLYELSVPYEKICAVFITRENETVDKPEDAFCAE